MLNEKRSQMKSDMLNKEGMFSASISDGDINLCNARVHSPESREHSDNLMANFMKVFLNHVRKW